MAFFFLACMFLSGRFHYEGIVVWVLNHVLLSRDPMDWNAPDSSVRWIAHTRILEWGVISFSSWSSWPRDQTCVPCTRRCSLYQLSDLGSPTRICCSLFHCSLLFIVQSLSVTPWAVVCQAHLFSTSSRRLLKSKSNDLVILPNHLILCYPLLLLP